MLTRLLRTWTRWVIGHARLVLALLFISTLGAAYFAVSAFEMNSDTSRLIRQDTEWRRTFDAFVDAFPQYDQNTFVVVSGSQPWVVSSVTRALTSEIKAQDAIFQSVYSPASSEFVDRNALLFLDPDTLNDTVSRLAEVQPFLTAIAGDQTLNSVLQLVIDSLDSDEELPIGFAQIADALNLAANRALDGSDKPISWRDELFQVDHDKTFYQIIFIKGQQNFGRDLPNAMVIGQLEQTIAGLSHPFKEDVEIRLTGQVPLEHGEIVSAINSAQLAGTLALLILIVILVWGVRSARIIAATYLAMLCGLTWTAALAMVTVGQFNTISIIFLVMFIGLGVDFAVHLCLKYQESRSQTAKSEALVETTVELGPAIILCGITSAIGFLAFVPTEYIGLREMGIISGGGMIIAVIISLTLIPAFFAVARDPIPSTDLSFADALTTVVAGNPKAIAYSTLLLAVVLAAVASQATFDYSTLSLKDPKSEAMKTLRELHEQNIVTDYALTYLADDASSAEKSKRALLQLDVVSEVKTPRDYLPRDQQEKFFILEDALFFLESMFSATNNNLNNNPTGFSDADLKSQLIELSAALGKAHSIGNNPASLQASLIDLEMSVEALVNAEPKSRELLTDLIVLPLKAEIDWLKVALTPGEVTLNDLPSDMRERLIAADGTAVISVTPAMDVLHLEAMREFTEAVMAIAPNVTGRPVLDLGIGDIVITAFMTALGIAVITIFMVLVMTLDSVLDSVLVFIPLVMTAMVALAFSVLADMPLNMANVIVIPLIFGLGVDNGIHMVKRYHQSANVAALMHSSTPKAVFLSNLTTIGPFCALSFSTHQGIYSIGVLLTVALCALVVLTLVSLPAMLAIFSPLRPQTR